MNGVAHRDSPRLGKRQDIAELSGSVGLGAWTAFGVLGLVVYGDGSPLFLDRAFLNWSVAHRPELSLAVARGLTATGTGVVPYALVLLAGLLVGRGVRIRKRLLAAVLGAGCLAAGQGVRYGVMSLIARPRPPRADWAGHPSGWAFPSGHTTTAALAAGLVILAICLRAPRGRNPLCAVVGCWGALVGLTRIYLGVHWFTDVIGGWLFATGWLGLCLCAAAWWLPPRLVTADGDGTDGTARGEGADGGDSGDTARADRAADHPDRTNGTDGSDGTDRTEPPPSPRRGPKQHPH
ncbi:phosphatase PAP2 family protein [Streptomyces sp. NPDC005423]|uniref:phosphatase PAP2 family protein n=1 Tax=Streptomyces sp. NPDC005423 TaxID=3155343 RepID=UPI0033B52FF2